MRQLLDMILLLAYEVVVIYGAWELLFSEWFPIASPTWPQAILMVFFIRWIELKLRKRNENHGENKE